MNLYVFRNRIGEGYDDGAIQMILAPNEERAWALLVESRINFLSNGQGGRIPMSDQEAHEFFSIKSVINCDEPGMVQTLCGTHFTLRLLRDRKFITASDGGSY